MCHSGIPHRLLAVRWCSELGGRLNPVESARPPIGQRGYCGPGGLVVERSGEERRYGRQVVGRSRHRGVGKVPAPTPATARLLASVRPIADPPLRVPGPVGRVPIPDPGKRTGVPLSQPNGHGRLCT